MVCIRSFQLTQKASKMEYKAIESVLQTINPNTGEVHFPPLLVVLATRIKLVGYRPVNEWRFALWDEPLSVCLWMAMKKVTFNMVLIRIVLTALKWIMDLLMNCCRWCLCFGSLLAFVFFLCVCWWWPEQNVKYMN